MSSFNDTTHQEVQSDDGSYTAYSKEYEEHYHSTKDGALKESYEKHVLPAFSLQQGKKELHILDICFGLGLNTLCTILHYKHNTPDVQLCIYSPELDKNLVKSLKHFHYPEEFLPLREMINTLSQEGVYEDKNFFIEIFLGDAREYLRVLHARSVKIDIVYQDPFSPKVNPILWTREYFADIKNLLQKDGVLTTYSTALKTRLALFENGFNVYVVKNKEVRPFTLASLEKLEGLEEVDMEHKIACNRGVGALSDTML